MNAALSHRPRRVGGDASRRRIGLTGGIASGKSTVGKLLAAHGAIVIDADQLARDVVAPGTAGLAAVVERFGEAVLSSDGSLDRAALGGIVFADPGARSDLEAIIHPLVRARSTEAREAAPADRHVVEMIPLLVEGGQADQFDVIIVVDLPVELQLERLVRRSGLTTDEADARLAAQASREQRLATATHVIDNSGTLEELAERVEAVWREVTAAR